MESDQKKMLVVLPPDADSDAAELYLKPHLSRKFHIQRVDSGVLFTSVEPVLVLCMDKPKQGLNPLERG